VLGEHVAGLEVDRVGAHVDDGSQTFAERFGFEGSTVRSSRS
jgi:hypothetical protein